MKTKLAIAVFALLAAVAMHNTLKLLFEGICIGVLISTVVSAKFSSKK